MLDGGEASAIFLAAVGLQGGRRGANQPRVDALLAIDPRLLAGGERGEVEVGVEAGADLGGGDPARERDQRGRVLQDDAGLLAQLADRRGAIVGVVGVDRSAGEHPDAAHELRLGRAPHEQELQRVCAAAQQDHGRGLARSGGRPGVVLLARGGLCVRRGPGAGVRIVAGGVLRDG